MSIVQLGLRLLHCRCPLAAVRAFSLPLRAAELVLNGEGA